MAIFQGILVGGGGMLALYAGWVLRFKLPPQIPLFYSRAWGEGQLATKQYIFLPIIGVLLLGVFNLGLAVSFPARDKVLAYLLAGTASLVGILSAITIFNIIRLIG